MDVALAMGMAQHGMAWHCAGGRQGDLEIDLSSRGSHDLRLDIPHHVQGAASTCLRGHHLHDLPRVHVAGGRAISATHSSLPSLVVLSHTYA